MTNKFDLETELLNKGKIFLFGEITTQSTLDFCQKLKYLLIKNTKKIFIYINSEGGDVDSANAIIDEIQDGISKGISINTVAYGSAASAAAIILAYGKTRFATNNSTIMLHPISYETGWDYHKYIKKHADFAGKISEKMIQNLATRCGYISYREQKQFATMIEESAWMSAQDAIDLKIIDKIWSSNAERRCK